MAGAVEPFGGGVKVALTEREDAPVGPCRRFSRSNPRGLLKAALGTHVVSYLKGGQTYIKSRNLFRICLGGRVGQLAAGMAARGEQRNGRQNRCSRCHDWTVCALHAVSHIDDCYEDIPKKRPRFVDDFATSSETFPIMGYGQRPTMKCFCFSNKGRAKRHGGSEKIVSCCQELQVGCMTRIRHPLRVYGPALKPVLHLPVEGRVNLLVDAFRKRLRVSAAGIPPPLQPRKQ